MNFWKQKNIGIENILSPNLYVEKSQIIKQNTIEIPEEMPLDEKIYDIKCEVIYCFKSDNKFRIGLRVVQKDKLFIQHLKIVIARISLRSKYT